MYILYIVYIMYAGIHKYRYIHIYVCFLYTCIYAFHKKGKNRACGTIQLPSIVLVMATNNKNNKNSLSNKVKVKGTYIHTSYAFHIYVSIYSRYIYKVKSFRYRSTRSSCCLARSARRCSMSCRHSSSMGLKRCSQAMSASRKPFWKGFDSLGG